MADEKYSIPENPQYKIAGIRKLQDTDPASATETFNPVFEPLLESMEYLNKHKAELSEDGKIPAEQLPSGVPGGVPVLDEDGKVPSEQLPTLGGHTAQSEEPENKNLLWIDTANGNIIKFYDPESETWKPVGAVWS